MGEYLVVGRGWFMGPHKWLHTEDEARATATALSKKSKSQHCKVTRVSLDGVEPIARYHRGKEVTA